MLETDADPPLLSLRNAAVRAAGAWADKGGARGGEQVLPKALLRDVNLELRRGECLLVVG